MDASAKSIRTYGALHQESSMGGQIPANNQVDNPVLGKSANPLRKTPAQQKIHD